MFPPRVGRILPRDELRLAPGRVSLRRALVVRMLQGLFLGLKLVERRLNHFAPDLVKPLQLPRQ